jgi:ABC-type lipoprotein export system ATPase subunit
MIALDDVSFSFGKGALEKQILFNITTRIEGGEIILLTGPSGSGKTTLLTLIGALRSAQQGSVKVLGQELLNAREKALTGVRRRIGYIFQSHNLLDSLTVRQNVQMALQLGGADGSDGSDRISIAAGGPRRARAQTTLRVIRRPKAACRHRPGPGEPAAGSAGRRAHGVAG